MAVAKKISDKVSSKAVPMEPVHVPVMWLKRMLVYGAGMFLLAMGVSFSIKSNLGVSPMNSLPYVISRVAGVDMGLVTTLVFSSYVVLQIFLLGRTFHLKNLLQVVVASLFGSFLSLTNRLLTIPAPIAYPIQILFLGISLVLIGAGIMLYMTGDLVPQPPEGLVMALAKKTGWSFSKVKVFFDCTVVTAAILISIFSGNGMMGVREGTLIAAVGIGKVIGWMSGWFRPALLTFCYGRGYNAKEIQ